MEISRPASAVQWARAFIHPALARAERVVDATAGNGHDTVFLAGGIGPAGHVYALDVQPGALEKTGAAVESAGLAGKVTLIEAGHQEMESLVPGPVSAVMFNLGYLPGGDRSLVTRPDTTGRGINASLRLLGPGGRLSVVVYTGHPGSLEESRAVAGIMAGLDLRQFTVQKLVFWNSRGDSPELYFVTRSGGDNG